MNIGYICKRFDDARKKKKEACTKQYVLARRVHMALGKKEKKKKFFFSLGATASCENALGVWPEKIQLALIARASDKRGADLSLFAGRDSKRQL